MTLGQAQGAPCVPREDTGDAVNQETGCPRRRVRLPAVLGLQPEEPWGRTSELDKPRALVCRSR